MKKRIVLCADDYGQALAISQGIVRLVEHGRLSAVSCMVNTPFWQEHAKWLKPCRPEIDVGLHFNLTEGKALSQAFIHRYGEALFSLFTLIRLSVLHQLDKAAIAQECEAQIDAFEKAFGELPDFIDGHQHIHQFPVVRDAVLEVYEKRLLTKKPYLRLAKEKNLKDIKKLIIYWLGASAFKALLDKKQLPYNHSFAGIYSFDKAALYPEYFPAFLNAVADGGVIMCHPGMAAFEGGDPIAKARPLEYQYLASEQFLRDCEAQNAVIRRFGACF